MKTLIKAIGIALLAQPVLAQETTADTIAKLSVSLANDLSSCAAYFQVASQAVREGTGDRVSQRRYAALRDDAIDIALAIASLNQAATAARAQVTQSYDGTFAQLFGANARGALDGMLETMTVRCPKLMVDASAAIGALSST